eukprot:Filipodium_phascolosomae@DN6848_c0_g1_i1.p1
MDQFSSRRRSSVVRENERTVAMESRLADEITENVFLNIFEYKTAVRRAAQWFDSDESGRISANELKTILEALVTVLSRPEEPMTEEQIEILVSSVELDDQGKFDFRDFLDSFGVIDEEEEDNHPQEIASSVDVEMEDDTESSLDV